MILWQPKPTGFTQFTLPKQDRAVLTSVRMDLDAEDIAELDKRARESGLRNRTRVLRWLLWFWKEVEQAGWGDGTTGKPVWKEGEGVYLALVKEQVGEGGKVEKRWIRRIGLPDGWRKG